MRRVNITLDEEVLKQVDSEAKEENESRSALLQRAVTSYLKSVHECSHSVQNDANSVHGEHTDELQREVNDLRLQIKDMKGSLSWLQGEYSRLADATIQKALPQPRKSVFSKLKFWKKD